MQWSEYQAGRRVVALRDFNQDVAGVPGRIDIGGVVLPSKGEICTIVSTELESEELTLTFVEHKPVDGIWHCHHGHRHHIRVVFEARYFRPLDESRLDVFRQHLADAPVDDAFERVPA